MDEKIFCAVKGRKIESAECSGIICNADDDCIAVCRSCAHGKALVSTAKRAVEGRAAQAAQAAYTEHDDTPPPPALGAWEKIQQATGCKTQEQLAKKIGTRQNKISLIMVKLRKGVIPSGREWSRLLEITGLMPEELLLAAGGTLRATAPASSTAPLPVTSSPPQPDDPNVGDMVELNAQEAYNAAGAAMGLELPIHFEQGLYAVSQEPELPSSIPYCGDSPTAKLTLMGAEPSEQLMRIEELDALRVPAREDCECNEGYGPCDMCASCRPDRFVRIDGKSIPRADLPPLTQHLLRVAQRSVDDAPARPLGTPDGKCAMGVSWAGVVSEVPPDFMPYVTGGSPISSQPGLYFTRAGEIGINAAAVRAYGLDKVERVQLFWSQQRGQIGLLPGQNGLKLQPNTRSVSCTVTARAFVRQFGVAPAKGPHLITQDPSGLLVATITQQPAHDVQQGGEA